jgi:hypothetical protein
MTDALRNLGIDARLVLLVPLATGAAVMATALLYAPVSGLADPPAAIIAALAAGLAGAVSLALRTASGAATGPFLMVLPGTLAGAVLAARLLDRASPAGGQTA